MVSKNEIFLETGDIGVLNFRTKDHQGIVPFKVEFAQVRPFLYGNLGSSLSPGGSYTKRLSGTFLGVSFTDILYYDKPKALLHLWLDIIPPMRVYPYFTAGNLQGDFLYTANQISAKEDQDWGWIDPPVEVMVVPKVNLDFHVYNPWGTETINPLIKFWYAEYYISLVKDPDIILLILQRKYRPEPKWFPIYGMRLIDYNFKDAMNINQPIPLDATREEIIKIVQGWW